jgi:hypothetical protein
MRSEVRIEIDEVKNLTEEQFEYLLLNFRCIFTENKVDKGVSLPYEDAKALFEAKTAYDMDSLKEMVNNVERLE